MSTTATNDRSWVEAAVTEANCEGAGNADLLSSRGNGWMPALAVA
jgi:hypothetical protein